MLLLFKILYVGDKSEQNVAAIVRKKSCLCDTYCVKAAIYCALRFKKLIDKLFNNNIIVSL